MLMSECAITVLNEGFILNMKSQNEYLEMRLHEWADWFKGGSVPKTLGFPKESIEYKLWKDGILVKLQPGCRGTLPTNSRAEDIEKCIREMQKVVPDQCKVIRARYFTNKKTPIEALAQRMSMNKRTFEDKLRLAKNFVLAWVTVSSTH